jgi:hypothetical protein
VERPARIFPDPLSAKIRRRPEELPLDLARDPAHQAVADSLDAAQALGNAL